MAKAKQQDEFVFETEKLTGIVEWASVLAPTHKYSKENSIFPNDKEYRVTLRLDNDTVLSQFNSMLEKHNISSTVLNPKTGQQVNRARQNKDGVLVTQFKRNFVTAQGKEVELKVVDRAAKPIPKELLIGNGSKATIKLSIMKNAETGEVRSILLDGLQVLEHKAVTNKSDDDFTSVDDFTESKASASSSPF
jgi:hypothetical protein